MKLGISEHYFFTDTAGQLKEAAEEWNKSKELAVDIECENNLHYYGLFISLVQVSSREKNWVVDVIKLKEIKPLLEMLENPRILKVFHDVDFDFRILNLQFSCRPKNVYDTQTAALLLGKENIGLGSLLESYFGIKKEKKFQMIDWTRRPLTTGMLEYAMKDTAYLLKLKDVLNQELKELNRSGWAEEEFAALDKAEFIYHEQTYLDVSGAKMLEPKEKAIFRALFEERKIMAQKINRPPFRIFNNQQMLAFAKDPPRDWRTVRSVHPLVYRRSAQLSQIVEKAKLEKEHLPEIEKKKLTCQEFILTKKILELRDEVAKKLGIKGYLLLNQEQVNSIAKTKSLVQLKNWQRGLLQEERLIKEIVNS